MKSSKDEVIKRLNYIEGHLRGIRKMPAMGGNPALTDLEVARGVVHMANAGGGKFAKPTAADAARWRKKAGTRR